MRHARRAICRWKDRMTAGQNTTKSEFVFMRVTSRAGTVRGERRVRPARRGALGETAADADRTRAAR
eukprot:gene14881-biopygen20143